MDSSSSSPLERLNDASRRAVELVDRFARTEPPQHEESDNRNTDINDKKNPWKNPQSIEEELIAARTSLAEAWRDLQAEHQRERLCLSENRKDDAEQNHGELSEEEFRSMYMDTITDAFADVLEEMQTETHQGSSNASVVDVEVLVDCLQSGIELLEDDQRCKRSYFESLTKLSEDEDANMEDERGNDDGLSLNVSIHEKEKRSLGWLPLVERSAV